MRPAPRLPRARPRRWPRPPFPPCPAQPRRPGVTSSVLPPCSLRAAGRSERLPVRPRAAGAVDIPGPGSRLCPVRDPPVPGAGNTGNIAGGTHGAPSGLDVAPHSLLPAPLGSGRSPPASRGGSAPAPTRGTEMTLDAGTKGSSPDPAWARSGRGRPPAGASLRL